MKGCLEYDKVMEAFNDMMEWLAGVYVNTLNVIHYMHDKYCYERAQMSLHDRDVRRYFATGIAGLSVVADSLSAIKYAKVEPIRDESGIIVISRQPVISPNTEMMTTEWIPLQENWFPVS